MSDDMVPSPVPSKQFSSDVNGDPKALLAEQEASHARFEALQKGLFNTLCTPGSHIEHPDSDGDKAE